MAKKRMGRNLNALLGGATRPRPGQEGDDGTDVATLDPARRPPGLRSVPAGAAAGAEGAPDAAPGEGPPIDDEAPRAGDRLRTVGIERVRRGIYQPRRQFDEALLQELADSIKAQGLIQPILVRERDGGYELIAGERRWRAAQMAGLHEIPAIVREMEDGTVAAVSLIENIQRKDLNPLEEASAFRRLCDDFAMTHQEVADAIGRSRVAVSNTMRLLDLHDDVKDRVDRGELEMGTARALLGAPLEQQPALAERVIKQRLTTRAVEKLVKEIREGRTPETPKAISDPDIERLSKKLGGVLGAPVKIRHRANGGGRLEISYTSVEELDGILGHIS